MATKYYKIVKTLGKYRVIKTAKAETGEGGFGFRVDSTLTWPEMSGNIEDHLVTFYNKDGDSDILINGWTFSQCLKSRTGGVKRHESFSVDFLDINGNSGTLNFNGAYLFQGLSWWDTVLCVMFLRTLTNRVEDLRIAFSHGAWDTPLQLQNAVCTVASIIAEIKNIGDVNNYLISLMENECNRLIQELSDKNATKNE